MITTGFRAIIVAEAKHKCLYSLITATLTPAIPTPCTARGATTFFFTRGAKNCEDSQQY
ncbi:MAG: hypothetical protein KBT34_12070 [Prevotella sp.]|nr:hypothetical protein [Candidatus Prevotella equi]